MAPKQKWTRERLERELDELGWDLVAFEPGGTVDGSSYGGKREERQPSASARRRANGASAFARSPAPLLDRIGAYERELASRGLGGAGGAVPVRQGIAHHDAPVRRRRRGPDYVVDLTDAASKDTK